MNTPLTPSEAMEVVARWVDDKLAAGDCYRCVLSDGAAHFGIERHKVEWCYTEWRRKELIVDPKVDPQAEVTARNHKG